MYPNIKEGALFISDAHENAKRDKFYHFLRMIESKEINPTQLFLMGDMFDLLVGEVKYLKNKYKKHIDLIEKIAQNIEVFYFEGNHDFSLEKIFKNAKVIDINKQPVVFQISNQKILLSHGDKYGGKTHTFYTSIIRSRTILKTLNMFDKLGNFFISKKIEKNLLKKDICTKISNFKEIISNKIEKNVDIEIDMIAEGHYHQNRSFKYKKYKYINFSSFACNQSYFIVQLSPDIKFIEKKLRGYDV